MCICVYVSEYVCARSRDALGWRGGSWAVWAIWESLGISGSYELKVIWAISLISVPVGPHGSLLVAVEHQSGRPKEGIRGRGGRRRRERQKRRGSGHTIPDLDLHAGIALGDIPHGSHHPRHGGRAEADGWEGERAKGEGTRAIRGPVSGSGSGSCGSSRPGDVVGRAWDEIDVRCAVVVVVAGERRARWR